MQFWIINNKQEWLKSQLPPFQKVIITSNVLRDGAIYLLYVLIIYYTYKLNFIGKITTYYNHNQV
jgi:hypothetical protein